MVSGTKIPLNREEGFKGKGHTVAFGMGAFPGVREHPCLSGVVLRVSGCSHDKL